MRATLRGITIAAFAVGAVLLAQMPGMGPVFGPEADEWLNHVPDLDSVSKSLQATQNLAKVSKDHPDIREKTRVTMGMGPGGRRGGMPAQVKMPTLDEMTAALEAYPEAKQAIESSGLGVRDYYKNTLSLMYGWAMFQMDKQGMLDQMLKMMPTMKRPANLDFIRANEPAIEKYVNAMQSMAQ